MHAALRRTTPEGQEPVARVGGLEIDLADHRVSRDGVEIHLTRTEFALLREFVRNRGKLLTHQHLLLHVWGAAYADDTATLRTHIANLRRKVETPDGPRMIRTETGVGYRLVV
nr:response regulator transcription factor [Patulibacter sp. SYSU D01012]